MRIDRPRLLEDIIAVISGRREGHGRIAAGIISFALHVAAIGGVAVIIGDEPDAVVRIPVRVHIFLGERTDVNPCLLATAISDD